MNKILITQPCMGDCLYCLKIDHKLIEVGYEVYRVIDSKYQWISNYIKKDNLNFGYPSGDHLILNLAASPEQNHPYDLMTCKYRAIGHFLPQLPKELHNIDNSDWQKYIQIKRNKEKENALYYDYLGLKDHSRYVFANQNYGVYQHREGVLRGVGNENNLPVVWNQFLDQFTMFDWIKVFENAEEIHTVDTSIMYVMESMPLKAKKLCLYPRHPTHVKMAMRDVLKLNWQYID